MNAILVTVLGEKFEEIFSHTLPLFERYARATGADLIYDLPLAPGYTPNCAHFPRMVELLDTYDQVAYMGADMVVKPDCPSLFDIAPRRFRGVFEARRRLRKEHRDIVNEFGYSRPLEHYQSNIVNGGLLVATPEFQDVLAVSAEDSVRIEEVQKDYKPKTLDQALINARLGDARTPVEDLGWRFNYMLMWSQPHSRGPEAHIIHLTTGRRRILPALCKAYL